MSRVYVGNLDPRVTERDLEDEFRIFGVLRSVWVARRPPGYAFIEFDDRRDAIDAIRELDGVYTLFSRAIVQEDLLGAAAYHLVVVGVTAGRLHIVILVVIHLMQMEIKVGTEAKSEMTASMANKYSNTIVSNRFSEQKRI
ncbi:hypothetical protein Goshw_024436 [Gossypium schwendimanii]|uniref:RRM domain-containing protein n=3 Tax=Gossypium TaxID=3633 RepID=A0A7J9LBT1_GOSSC|nr:hypothetical protein [Gossypium aridum]MBA0711639.1 hypothetical protein [Gossypium laxum]MBA0856180.1 hypothetical protein [Gossypium schwendimanii]